MTYDPGRHARADIGRNPGRYERYGTGLSVALMLAIMAAFVAVGFWLSATSHHGTVAYDDRPAAERSTTGAGSRDTPLPNTPTPPTVPSPPRQ